MYNIGIVDDEILIRQGLQMLINQHPKLNVSLMASNGKDCLSQLEANRDNLPALLLCDIEMPEMDGVALTRQLQYDYPDIEILILSSHYEDVLIMKMIEIGASGFMSKTEEPNEFYKTIIGVMENGFYYNDHVVQLIRQRIKYGKSIERPDLVKLSTREVEVLKLLCEEKSNKEIAAELFISPRTVEGHRNKLLEKTGSKNSAGLIIYAIEKGIYSLNIDNKKQW